MTDKTLKRLSRSELLELLLAQTREREALEKKLEDRQLQIEKAGDIAHAVLEINGVMNATQAAAQQYLDNIARMEQVTKLRCEKMLHEARMEAARIRKEAKAAHKPHKKRR